MKKRIRQVFDNIQSQNTIEYQSKRMCTSWNCIYCKNDNVTNHKLCNVCNAWICDHCKCVNPPNESRCMKCNNQSYLDLNYENKIIQSTKSTLSVIPPSSSTWTCNHCTLINANINSQCDICKTYKPNSSLTNAFTVHWKCKMCTLINHIDRSRCKICYNKNDTIYGNTNITNSKKTNNDDYDGYTEKTILNTCADKTTKQLGYANINEYKSKADYDIMNLAKIQLNKMGFKSFRPSQYAVIKDLINNVNTMLIMPTGGGKSLCFQIPMLVLNALCNQQQKNNSADSTHTGIGIVISPLISLMHDQVYKLKNQYNIDAEYINGSLRKSQRELIIQKLKNNKIEILYGTPELFTSSCNKIIKILVEYRIITVLAIDEAHCISKWGNSFRPSYANLSKVIDDLNNPITLLCTATATEKVREDILDKLNLRKDRVNVHKVSIDRPNIFMKCIRLYNYRNNIEHSIMNEITLFLNDPKIMNKSVVIFCGTIIETRKTTH